MIVPAMTMMGSTIGRFLSFLLSTAAFPLTGEENPVPPMHSRLDPIPVRDHCRHTGES
jgi:hypothetical protein